LKSNLTASFINFLFSSYFAAVNFSYGCTPRNWRNVQALLAKKNIYFFPSVGPGYDDTSIRPWNAQNSKNRENGKYYLNYWSEAMKINPKVILEQGIKNTLYKNYNVI
jgi:glycoprotein endo-alpha-1,2-mannosidase